MKKIGLIILCVGALYGCKSRQSHVQKVTMDSVTSNREITNMDVQVSAYKAQHTLLQADSNWLNTFELKNFKGIIYPDGRFEGEAENAQIKQSGEKSQQENTKTESKDSASNQSQGITESLTKVKKRNTVADKETKGVAVPFGIWLLVIVAIVFLLLTVYKRIKSKLKPF